jgi:lipoprotein-releasing system permease protein
LLGGQVLVSTAGHALGGQIRGEAVADVKSQHAISDHIDAGSLADLDEDSVLIGSRLAANLGVHVGDVIGLLASDSSQAQYGSQLHSQSYRIAGTFAIGEYNFDSATIIMPIAAAQKFFNVPGVATSIELFTTDAGQAAAIAWGVREAVGPRFRVADWTLSLTGYLNELATQRNVLSLILTLIIMVAAFNIVSSMMMLVKDKAKDIAILRTMGATQGMVLRIFCLTGSSIGIVGTLLGLGLGVAFAENIEAIRQFIQHLTGTDLFDAKIYFLSHLPVRLAPVKVATIVLAAFALSFVATLYPSWRAARRDPVEALRNET